MTKVLESQKVSLKGEIAIPGDKSISHRAVMFGSIAEGKTTVHNFLEGEDCLSTIECFRAMGVEITRTEDVVEINGRGFNGLKEPSQLLDVGNSGTTTRLILGLLAGTDFHSCLIGDDSIAKRPMARVTVPLRLMGAKIDGRENGQYTPLAVRGHALKGITYESPVASAQIKSSILLAGINAEGKTTVKEPHKSRDHTERMLGAFGVEVESDETSASVEGGQTLKGTTVNVPGDISSAAFFLVAGAIVPNSRIRLQNVGLNPTRTGIVDVLDMMNVKYKIEAERVENGEPVGDFVVETSDIKGTEISGDLIPRLIDEIPIIALLATQAEGETIIKDAAELRVKETDRISTVATELNKLGADITPTEDGMIIKGGTPLHGGNVDSHGDHRIGMMLAVASLITSSKVELERPEAISVSYPTFFEHLAKLSR
ncbi:3-phosphoshikimate 1-carboxyvinyltransferase [Priestia filamentosa]|uniref:3-phosphoshikimate 1-carboxyvinyltransferase n=1 Tax=Priestia filamentosa TaxID=1402861 RepID=UPI003B84AE6D